MDTAKSTTLAVLRTQIAELEQQIRNIIREGDVEVETAPDVVCQGVVEKNWL